MVMKRMSLLLYNLLFVPILLFLLPGYLLRIARRGGYRTKASQRFGIFDRETLERVGTGRIWLHAVSVGEVGIALKFAAAFRRRNPRARFLLSTTTSTGLAIVERNASEWLEPVANPVDFPILTSLLVRKLIPSALLMVEADLWPNRVRACRRLGIPVVLLNSRLSKRSEGRFRRARWITAPLFNGLDMITLTEKEDAARWHSLGIRPDILRWTGNMKYDTARTPDSVPFQASLDLEALGWSDGDPLLLAASTHAGEEEAVARAFLSLRGKIPRLRLVIAPRHAERRGGIAGILRRFGLTCILRSEGHSTAADVLVLDTTGELSRWYGAATVVFVGKSLPGSANKGGQNMIEPLQSGCPVLIGPHTENFEPLATRLAGAGALLRVTDAANLAEATSNLLLHPERRTAMVRTAQAVLQEHQGATERNCGLVELLLADHSMAPAENSEAHRILQ
jgi:3-deoxy-D-manno-octulosonic-acid transferase